MVFSFNELCKLLQIWHDFEKTCSMATLAAGIARYSQAICAIVGKSTACT
jgi:hypothetical protein